MNYELMYITWNPSSTIFRIGHFALHWYSMCWLVGLLLAYLLVRRLYKEQKIKDELFDPLFIYCFIGILAGARLGHCFFYQPDIFLSSWQHFVEVFIPIEFMGDGSWQMISGQTRSANVRMCSALWIDWFPRIMSHAVVIPIHF